MRVTVTAEHRFTRTPDGVLWAQGAPYAFWSRYLSSFDRVRVLARVLDAPAAPPGAERVEGDRVEVLPVPHYVGPRQFVLKHRAVVRLLGSALDAEDAVVLRVPSAIGTLAAGLLVRRRRHYALEVVGDPADVFRRGVVDHPLRPLIRRWFVAGLRGQCRRADAVAYVTGSVLQARYPAGPDALTAAYSSIDLHESAFVATPPRSRGIRGPARLVSVGSMDQRYKGFDTLIEALPRLVDRGIDVHLDLVGGGRHEPALRRLAQASRVEERVTFHGPVPSGDAVRRVLDAADLFVLASRAEGLPRALIEAMARGLPAVGSTAGGIPELLPPRHLVPPDDDAALAAAIAALLASPAWRREAAKENLAVARRYAAVHVRRRREAFYRGVRDRTARHRGGRRPAPVTSRRGRGVVAGIRPPADTDRRDAR